MSNWRSQGDKYVRTKLEYEIEQNMFECFLLGWLLINCAILLNLNTPTRREIDGFLHFVIWHRFELRCSCQSASCLHNFIRFNWMFLCWHCCCQHRISKVGISSMMHNQWPYQLNYEKLLVKSSDVLDNNWIMRLLTRIFIASCNFTLAMRFI